MMSWESFRLKGCISYLSFVDERTHGVGDMDFVRKDDETVHRAPPLYQFFPKCVPGEDAVGVRQDEAVNG